VASTGVGSAGAWKKLGSEGDRAGGRGSIPVFVRNEVRAVIEGNRVV
jgi:hypothetical protein